MLNAPHQPPVATTAHWAIQLPGRTQDWIKLEGKVSVSSRSSSTNLIMATAAFNVEDTSLRADYERPVTITEYV
jgi:hypothetical protein